MSKSTHTFKSSCGEFQYTVKQSFTTKVFNPQNYESYYLFAHAHMEDYLHNENGPAIYHIKTGKEEYWINGHKLSEQESKRFLFSKKMSSIINE